MASMIEQQSKEINDKSQRITELELKLEAAHETVSAKSRETKSKALHVTKTVKDMNEPSDYDFFKNASESINVIDEPMYEPLAKPTAKSKITDPFAFMSRRK
jgi:hypothetical protein